MLFRQARAPRKPEAGCVPPTCSGPSLWLRLKLFPAWSLVIIQCAKATAGCSVKQGHHHQGATSSPAREPSPDPGYSSHRDRKGTHIYALIKLETGKKSKVFRPRSSHGHSLPWQGLVRSQYSMSAALRADSPNPAEQGRTVSHMVLLLVVPLQRKGLGRP